MKQVFNPYDHQVAAAIVDGDGNLDGVHVQPGGQVKLKSGFSLAESTMSAFPRLRVTDDTVVGTELPVIKQPEVAVAVGSTDNKGSK